eukprot:m.43781 g.43781  ORF g.43781 m.43781 type:complete len:330 (+) comp6448_c0_seq2:39-1028(+)
MAKSSAAARSCSCCAVTPTAVTTILLSLVCVTTTMYYFAPPASIARGKASDSGIFGPPDGEFDWCEVNFVHTELIAEPLNTITSGLYVMAGAASVFLHSSRGVQLPSHLFAQSIIIALIGLGSICFHATLRYNQQLWDELPMYWLIIAGSVTYFTRAIPPANADTAMQAPSWLPTVAAVWAFAVTAVILLTERDGLAHVVSRGVLTCSFSGLLVYTFTAGARTAQEIDAASPSGAMGLTSAATLFAVSFWSFIAGVLTWIVDILFCADLQNLAIYPNLHSAWHVGSAYGSYGLLVLGTWHEYRIRQNRPVALEWVQGWCPVITLKEATE